MDISKNSSGKEIIESKLEGSRRRGRPRLRWLKDVEENLREMRVRDGDRRRSTMKNVRP